MSTRIQNNPMADRAKDALRQLAERTGIITMSGIDGMVDNIVDDIIEAAVAEVLDILERRENGK